MTAGKWQYAKQKPTPGKVCKDCLVDYQHSFPASASVPATIPEKLRRPAPYPGPRCATHHNKARRDRRLAGKVRHVERTYGLTPEQYDALYEFQGGQCAFRCGATGASKRLAVDHDHHQAMLDGHDPDKGCPNCVRGLVCSTCNDVLAHARSMPGYFARGQAYLQMWPMARLRAGHAQWPPLPEAV